MAGRFYACVIFLRTLNSVLSSGRCFFDVLLLRCRRRRNLSFVHVRRISQVLIAILLVANGCSLGFFLDVFVVTILSLLWLFFVEGFFRELWFSCRSRRFLWDSQLHVLRGLRLPFPFSFLRSLSFPHLDLVKLSNFCSMLIFSRFKSSPCLSNVNISSASARYLVYDVHIFLSEWLTC